jgi:hypothetical protein
MDVTLPISRSFADEHVIGIDPPLQPELANVWRRRINAFTGRALSDKAMSAEQAMRSGLQRLEGLSRAPGLAEGLMASAEPGAVGLAPATARLLVTPGIGIARSGEDVQIGRPLRIALGDLPVILPVAASDALGPMSDAGGGVAAALADANAAPPVAPRPARLAPEAPRRVGDTLAAIAANPKAAALPRVGVLVAQPIAAEILANPLDTCPPDPRDDPYVDLQRIDGCRLALYLWPEEMLASDGGADYALVPESPARRNRLAHAVFALEQDFAGDEMHPWEAWGLPLALVGLAPDWSLEFVDRASVARIGGGPRARTALTPGQGDGALWQARLDQFTTQLAELPSHDVPSLQAAFRRLPPVGVLPAALFDPVHRHQHFFPWGYEVTAVPVAQSNLDIVVAESAGLAPLDLGQHDTVQLLVPVPDEVYEPGLLQIEVEDPRFGAAIIALRGHRQTVLQRRQVMRRRRDCLMASVWGQLQCWPQADLPLEEDTPAPHSEVPVEMTRTRRVTAAAGVPAIQAINGAAVAMPVHPGDTIWFWACIHDKSTLTGLSLRVAGGTNSGSPAGFIKGAFWGAADQLPIQPQAFGPAASPKGPLPDPGVWTRYEVPASAVWDANGWSIIDLAVDSVEFAQAGGDVEWGAFGKRDAAGQVTSFLVDEVPIGALVTQNFQEGATLPWATVPNRDQLGVDDYGTRLDGDTRRAAALDVFRTQWNQPFLVGDLATIDATGINPFLTQLEARLKATNDTIDLGFLRARADIYRVRQIMLGADAASRLVTSPALADLAQRNEGARATSDGISAYLTAAAARDPGATVISMTAASAVAASAGTVQLRTAPAFVSLLSNTVQPATMTLNIARTAGVFVAPPVSGTVVRAAPAFTRSSSGGVFVPPPAPASGVTLAPAMVASTPLFAGSAQARVLGNLSVVAAPAYRVAPALSVAGTLANLRVGGYLSSDIQRQIPVAGLVERTVSVAERLTPQPSVQALEYALGSKSEVIAALTGLVNKTAGRPAGIALGDIPMAGFNHRTLPATDPGYIPTLDQLIADRTRTDGKQPDYVDGDQLPASTAQKHESDYFTAAVQAIDNSIAIMRLVEGRIALYSELVSALQDAQDAIDAALATLSADMRANAVELAEARHDLGTAEMLRAEEDARVDTVNARRQAILATRVRAVAWRRQRMAQIKDEAPLITAASGLLPSPVVVCQREHPETPDEIHDYVQLLREVPVSWFPAIAAQVHRIERLDSAQASLVTMIERATWPMSMTATTEVFASQRYLAAAQTALVGARQMVASRQATIASINAARVAALSLAEAHLQLRAMASLGDLITGSHRQPALARAAAAEIDGVATIASCLHEGFCAVAPAVRLGWAEMLSEFSASAPLAHLAGLPGWTEVPVEDRRSLQGLVDWLFAQVDNTQAQAHGAINELVRICLLMAAHAPVDKLIPARLVAPTPARIGGRIMLAVDITRVRQGMLTLVRDDAGGIIARGRIEDIVAGQAHASVTHIIGSFTTFSPAMRVELVGGSLR